MRSQKIIQLEMHSLSCIVTFTNNFRILRENALWILTIWKFFSDLHSFLEANFIIWHKFPKTQKIYQPNLKHKKMDGLFLKKKKKTQLLSRNKIAKSFIQCLLQVHCCRTTPLPNEDLSKIKLICVLILLTSHMVGNLW